MSLGSVAHNGPVFSAVFISSAKFYGSMRHVNGIGCSGNDECNAGGPRTVDSRSLSNGQGAVKFLKRVLLNQ